MSRLIPLLCLVPLATALPLTDADPNDANDYSDVWNAKIDTLNASIRLTYGTHVVEFHDAVLGTDGKADPSLYRTPQGDTVHPNDDGEHVIEAVARATLH